MVALPLQSFAVHPIERRHTERHQLGLEVTVTFNCGGYRWTETDAVLADLSRAGMFVRCDRVPQPHHRVLIGFVLPDGRLCAGAGRPVRVDGWGGFGVRFDSINEPLTELAEQLKLVSPPRRIELLEQAEDLRIWVE